MGIESLKQLDLHDSSMELFQIDLLKKEIRINVSIYNNSSNEYCLRKLIFGNVAFVELGYWDTEDISLNEIYSFEVSEQLNCKQAKFVLLLGTGKPSLNMSFCFGNVSIG